MSNIVKLLSDLGCNAELQSEYQTNAEQVMDQFGLSEEEKDAMRCGDVDKVKSLTNQESIKMFDSIIKSYK